MLLWGVSAAGAGGLPFAAADRIGPAGNPGEENVRGGAGSG